MHVTCAPGRFSGPSFKTKRVTVASQLLPEEIPLWLLSTIKEGASFHPSVQWEAIIQFAVLQVEAERFVEMDGRMILFPDVQVERFQVMFVARGVDDV